MTVPAPPSAPTRLASPAFALLLAGLAGCAGGRGANGPAPGEDRCVFPASIGPSSPAIVAALPGPIDPAHAPVPRSEAERFVFAQLYETLVRIDCRGEARPLLASSWRVDDDGRRWTFHLRTDPRTWNGAVVTTSDVSRSWLATTGAGDLVALDIFDDSTLRVDVPAPVTPAYFARPEMAVALPADTAGWPAGTGPYSPAAAAAPGPLSGLVLRAVSGHGEVVFRLTAGDPRNAVDAGVDLLVTRDPATLDYAAAGGGYQRAPLPWDRAYLLLVPGRVSGRDHGGPTPAALRALARDAVRVEARPAEAPPGGMEACPPVGAPADPGFAPGGPGPGLVSVSGGTSAGQRAVVFPGDDATAAGLAQRLVALARTPETEPWVAATLAASGAPISARGLPGDAFGQALERGDAAAFILPVQRTTATSPCGLFSEARRRAPWLRTAGTVPLVETRRTVLFREGVTGLGVDGAGTLLLPETAARRRRP